MQDAVLTLISNTYVKNEYGVSRPVSTERTIFCRVGSISRQEFYEAGRNGLNPEYEFTVFSGDYEGESVCEFEGARYSIYRTYRVPGTDDMELYAQREGGTNG